MSFFYNNTKLGWSIEIEREDSKLGIQESFSEKRGSNAFHHQPKKQTGAL
jgi:hypothetical protein